MVMVKYHMLAIICSCKTIKIIISSCYLLNFAWAYQRVQQFYNVSSICAWVVIELCW